MVLTGFAAPTPPPPPRLRQSGPVLRTPPALPPTPVTPHSLRGSTPPLFRADVGSRREPPPPPRPPRPRCLLALPWSFPLSLSSTSDGDPSTAHTRRPGSPLRSQCPGRRPRKALPLEPGPGPRREEAGPRNPCTPPPRGRCSDHSEQKVTRENIFGIPPMCGFYLGWGVGGPNFNFKSFRKSIQRNFLIKYMESVLGLVLLASRGQEDPRAGGWSWARPPVPSGGTAGPRERAPAPPRPPEDRPPLRLRTRESFFLVLRTGPPFTPSCNVWLLRPSALASLSASALRGCFPGFRLLPAVAERRRAGVREAPFLGSQRQSRPSSPFSRKDPVSCLQKQPEANEQVFRRPPNASLGPWVCRTGHLCSDRPGAPGAGRTVLCALGKGSVRAAGGGGQSQREEGTGPLRPSGRAASQRSPCTHRGHLPRCAGNTGLSAPGDPGDSPSTATSAGRGQGPARTPPPGTAGPREDQEAPVAPQGGFRGTQALGPP